VAGRVPLRLMSYSRSFRFIRTHVLVREQPTGAVEHDRAAVYEALGEGRCYIAVDAFAPARGFAFWASDDLDMGAEAEFGGQALHVRLPRPAAIRLLRDGVEVAAAEGAALDHEPRTAGAYRVEVRLAGRTWILSNPIYLR
jgi:hypothetical protein